MVQTRDHQFDNIKAILIFLVVLGHILSRFGDSVSVTILYKIIFSFHIPAFFFVSGYFAKFDPKKVLGRLFLLYLVFQLIQIFERFFLRWIATGTIPKLSIDIFTPQWTLWYLVALMIFQLLLPVFDTENRKHQLAFLLLSLGLGFAIGFTAGVDNLLAISRVFVFLPFYMLGYYEKKNGFLRTFAIGQHRTAAGVAAAVTGVVLVVCFCLFHTHIRVRYLYGTDVFTDPKSMIWRFLAWGIAFLWICILLTWVPRRSLGYLGTIGKHSMSIYLLHSLVIRVLLQTPLAGWIGSNLLTIGITAAILTFALSWKGFYRALRKIRIPVGR